MTTTTAPRPMTAKQRAIYEYIRAFRQTHGFCASIREVRDAFRFDSTNGVMCHLVPLRRKGFVTWEKGQARTLRITEEQA